MTSKKIYFSKFVVLTGFLLITLSTQSYSSSSREVNKLLSWNKTIINKTLTDSIKDNTSLEESIVRFGMTLLDTPYVTGGSGKNGFDCSGFVHYVFQHFKITVPRSSSQFKNFGKEIALDSIRKGDILVFLSPTRNAIGHVGIVTNPKGKESDFIHSSSGREMKVIVTSLKKEGYTRRFVKAVRAI